MNRCLLRSVGHFGPGELSAPRPRTRSSWGAAASWASPPRRASRCETCCAPSQGLRTIRALLRVKLSLALWRALLLVFLKLFEVKKLPRRHALKRSQDLFLTKRAQKKPMVWSSQVLRTQRLSEPRRGHQGNASAKSKSSLSASTSLGIRAPFDSFTLTSIIYMHTYIIIFIYI